MSPTTEAIKALFSKMKGKKVLDVWTQFDSEDTDDPDRPGHLAVERVVIDYEGPRSVYVCISLTGAGETVSGFGEYPPSRPSRGSQSI